MMSESPGRRSLDVDPATQLFVRDEVAETRHKLLNELSALGTRLELFAAQSTAEHGEVKAKLDRLSDDVAELKPLAQKVAALQLADATAEASAVTAERMRTQLRTQFFALATLFVAVAGVIVAFGH